MTNDPSPSSAPFSNPTPSERKIENENSPFKKKGRIDTLVNPQE
jgi:hypothetical protein